VTPEQFDKLPKYARDEITSLMESTERALAEAKWLRDENRVKAGASNTVVVQGLTDRTPLISFAEIEFTLGYVGEYRKTVSVRLRRNGGLEVYGNEHLCVLPTASNHIIIETKDR